MTTTKAKPPVKLRTLEDLRAAIASKSNAESGGCLIWTGATDKDGYPKISIDNAGHCRQVHRIHWELEGGQIPEGFQLSRLSTCPNRRCIAPEHLVLSKGPLTAARATHSPNTVSPTFNCGHARTPANTNKKGGCRSCRLAYQRRYNATLSGRSTLIDTPMPYVGAIRQRTK
ncbi:hypothetical protein [Paenarthrobacter sp. YJN-5]|uniref:hypothetical protein n=1 Tax=Paenarthrobacter sp. YJN-5 TaxID=2735316 RepID=UPI00187866F9|nr:hypothetical protein [Paenarthrobacter sp. YJN-5]QOT19278.1 hypothetical protein HMI59_21490 [Paenarthrobacter sp. YJN-5]